MLTDRAAAASASVGAALADWARSEPDADACMMHEDWNLLQYACSIGDADALQYMLEQRKADANFQTQSKAVPRLAPVHVVAGFDHHDLLPLLPSHTNVNKQDQHGFTALHYAVTRAHSKTVKALLDRGASVLIKSNRGVSPLDIARSLDYAEIASLLESKSKIETDPSYAQFESWLRDLGALEYMPAFVAAGYDLPFIQAHGINDADLDCVGVPRNRLGLRKKLTALHLLDRHYTPVGGDEEEEEEDGEEDEEGEEEEEDE